MPSGREEDWRFTPVDRLRVAADPRAPATTAPCTCETSAPAGVELLDLPLTDERVGQSFVPADRAAVTAWNSTASGAVRRHPQARPS